MTAAVAAVLRAPHAPFTLENLQLRALADDEVLVEVHAVGMCRTDFAARHPQMTAHRPVVVGHEGAGVVVGTGAAVREIQSGDHVVLSFDSCGSCRACTDAVGTCPRILELNMGLYEHDQSATDAHGAAVSARWFAQSSFASHAIATERNAIVVDPQVPLEVLAPFGCSVSTGVGAVVHTLAVTAGSSVAVFGTGAVGMAAIMGARIAGATTIIAVDVHDSRLAAACRLGATGTARAGAHTRQELAGLVGGGLDFAVDTTGVNSVVADAIAATALGGKIALIGGLQTPLPVSADMLHGKTLIGVLGGGRAPRELVPQLITWWQQGRLPVEQIITRYPLAQINLAEAASRDGTVIKPVLLPDRPPTDR